mmetsp:Transcript_108299/g.305318  ORF Transcript_108299/g.305318 Transcript_108299/m.305318 type:complete len:233 (+) Transcript_108299:4211-4909(+)
MPREDRAHNATFGAVALRSESRLHALLGRSAEHDDARGRECAAAFELRGGVDRHEAPVEALLELVVEAALQGLLPFLVVHFVLTLARATPSARLPWHASSGLLIGPCRRLVVLPRALPFLLLLFLLFRSLVCALAVFVAIQRRLRVVAVRWVLHAGLRNIIFASGGRFFHDLCVCVLFDAGDTRRRIAPEVYLLALLLRRRLLPHLGMRGFPSLNARGGGRQNAIGDGPLAL